MTSGRFRFGRFVLDAHERQLMRDGVPLDLNARYLDALALMVREQGKLVSKDRFLEEVWRGVPVTDEALTQCIRTLRRHLDDDTAKPRFIETVVKHGYRFIAPVESIDPEPNATVATALSAPSNVWAQVLRLGGAGTLGAAIAGALGGLVYGFVAASQPLDPGTGAISALLVIWCLTIGMALIGGAGVSFGIAVAAFLPGSRPVWRIAGGAAGGVVIGAAVKLIGLDAFSLLFGQSPGAITGAPEGALLGGAVGVGAWLASAAPRTVWRHIRIAALAGAASGIVIALLGGRLMWGSLVLLGQHFPASRLGFAQIWGALEAHGLGVIGLGVTGAFEGALFGGGIVGAMCLAGTKPRA